MDKPEKFYITTPIYYVNARPHIGHTYTTVVCDTVARRQRLMGMDTWFLTGTDEHGQKIERSASAAGCSPKEFTDRVSGEFRQLWDRMKLTYDDFIRTTEPRHVRGVQALFKRLQERGYIYKGSYSGQYCVFDELYVDVTEPGAPCPECGRPTETVQEENYFFKLSAMEGPLLKLFAENPDFIRPETRRNEVISFVRSGLRDLSVSRTTVKWGIPVPGDEKHVIYVWFDALANYITALGFGSDDPKDKAKLERYWPADVHMVGKEIVRFHCVYWPAMLLAAGHPAAQVDRRARLAAVRREQDVEVARQYRAQRNYPRHARRRHAALFPVARNCLWQRRIVQLRRAGAALQRRPCKRLGKSVEPDAEHDHALLRGRDSVPFSGRADAADDAVAELAQQTITDFNAQFEQFQFSRALETAWGLGCGGQQVHRRERTVGSGGERRSGFARASGDHPAHVGRSVCESSPRWCIR